MVGFGPTIWSRKQGRDRVRHQGHPDGRLHPHDRDVPARRGRPDRGPLHLAVARHDRGRPLGRLRGAPARRREPALLHAQAVEARDRDVRRTVHEPGPGRRDLPRRGDDLRLPRPRPPRSPASSSASSRRARSATPARRATRSRPPKAAGPAGGRQDRRLQRRSPSTTGPTLSDRHPRDDRPRHHHRRARRQASRPSTPPSPRTWSPRRTPTARSSPASTSRPATSASPPQTEIVPLSFGRLRRPHGRHDRERRRLARRPARPRSPTCGTRPSATASASHDSPVGVVGAARIGGEVMNLDVPAQNQVAMLLFLLAGLQPLAVPVQHAAAAAAGRRAHRGRAVGVPAPQSSPGSSGAPTRARSTWPS